MLALYLRKVDIQGFKSFADKTEIEFKNDITAIVGPNGSGKSNISDAIRWVLGEQSVKSLRGSKMEDVIFSGTDKRRALGYAEVTMIFDNKDGKIPIEYAEVAVTRRMFRSGESEYYLNKNSCRLKDIRELFMDTGIGKDGYSIIGQGKIDEILSNKPEDRRSIFEEAAGITKYKSKKDESERKLERTENNILRIKDLIHEVANQKETLEKEAKKAHIFTKLFTRLKDLEINIYINDIKKLNKQIETITKEKENNLEEISIIQYEKYDIEKKYNLLKENLQDMENEIEESRTIKFDAISLFEKNKNQLSILSEKESFLKKDLERLNNENMELEQSLIDIKTSKETIDEEINLLTLKLESFKDQYQKNYKELETLNLSLLEEEKEIEKEKNHIMSIYNAVSDKRSQINSIISFNDNIEKRIAQLNREMEIINNNTLDINTLIKELEVVLIQLDSDLTFRKENFNKLKNDKLKMETDYRSLNESIKSNQINVQGLTSNYNLFKNMEEMYEGYYKSVKGLLQASKKNLNLGDGLIGVVAELLSVDEKFEKAINVSLGSSIQHIVVKNEENAKNMVEYLKQQKLGRATFLPLNTIKGKSITLNSNDIQEFNILGLGSELITYNKDYQNIFDYLLGRTIIVNDIESGIRFARKNKHSYKIVTLDGEVLNIGGSITGGSIGENSINIINRKNKISNLRKEIDTINNNLNKLQSEKSFMDEELSHITENLTDEELLIKTNEQKIFEGRNKLENYHTDIKKLQEEKQKKENEVLTLSKEIGDFKSKKEELTSSLNGLEKEIELSKEQANKKQDQIEEKRQLKNNLETIVTDLKIDVNLLENNYKNLVLDIDNKTKDKEKIIGLIDEKNSHIISINQEILGLEQEKDILNNEIQNQETKEAEITNQLNLVIKKKECFMKTFYEEQERLKHIHNKLSEIEKHKSSLDIKLTRCEMLLENNHARIFEEYELKIEETMKYEKDIGSFQNAASEVKKLKSDIKDLGNVNIGSIEEFEKTNERYEFITAQHSDLTKAKENLKEVISDMEKKMRTQFISSFKEINESFTEVFSVLFNGGKATLELEEGEDILNAGIEIKAQPPGKKLQNLTLLSGGEKSLTAVALLFAILKTKPAPFCILDEIDAALDEANINRYTSYLKSFDDMTQFVLITHRKTTMEIADVLYGVTMEEQGISKLISIKLKDSLENLAG